MEKDTAWSDDEFEDTMKGTGVFHSYLPLIDEDDKEGCLISIDLVLPDELLERILGSLPLACLFKACCVCKKWNEIVHSKRFMLYFSARFSQKPWYFMFTSSDEPTGYAYDPTLLKWYSFELPYIENSNWSIASSCGLVCFMDNENRSCLCVCNPLTKTCKKLEDPSGQKSSDYSALSLSVDRSSHSYTVAVVRSKQASVDYLQWDLSIHVYYSETMTWVSLVMETLTGWRGDADSVICDGVLYFLGYATRGMGAAQNRHCLFTCNLYSHPSEDKLVNSSIEMPCSLTCGRLMNLKDSIVMVGGIGRHDRADIIKGIGIWVLEEKNWVEVSRMPHKFFQGFGEFDEVYVSSGSGDLVYIQSYGATALLVFDMNLNQWNWSQKCPVTKRFPLQLFRGFCFEPRLGVSP
ncbi:hypothetical protein U1Q18_019717 [Sarracenia purpurea var. burkii]